LITACIPFVENKIVAKKVISNSPPLLFVTISIIVVSRKPKAATGRILSKSFINSSWKFGNGTNGINVNIKIEAGRRAISKLKAIDEALVTRTPFVNPFTTNFSTFLIGIPSNPGRTILSAFSFQS
jgi:hypothetical protein